MKEWVCLLSVAGGTKPGLAARIVHAFAQRGISLTAFLATTYDDEPVVALSYRATERMRNYLVRRLSRIEDVTRVRVVPADGRQIWSYLEAMAG